MRLAVSVTECDNEKDITADVAGHARPLEPDYTGPRFTTPPTRFRKGVLPDAFMNLHDTVIECEGIITELLERGNIEMKVDLDFRQFG